MQASSNEPLAIGITHRNKREGAWHLWTAGGAE